MAGFRVGEMALEKWDTTKMKQLMRIESPLTKVLPSRQ